MCETLFKPFFTPHDFSSVPIVVKIGRNMSFNKNNYYHTEFDCYLIENKKTQSSRSDHL
jgi:hypothetical protein